MHFLASYYNMTVFHYKTPRIPDGRDYLIEVNPNYVKRDSSDAMNVIDARWTDTESGLFIDITAVRKLEGNSNGDDILSCKDKHEYKVCAQGKVSMVALKLMQLAGKSIVPIARYIF